MSTRLVPLTQIKNRDVESDELVVVVETPKNSRSKYAYDEETGAFELKFVLPEGDLFPVDFGFVPSTLADDGDPLDVVLLLDESLAVGTKVRVRLVGAIKAKERENDGEWDRNDRLIAVAVHAHTFEGAHSIEDLDPKLLQTIEEFFERYNRLHGKAFKVKQRVGAADAAALLKKGCKKFKNDRD